MKRLLIVLFLIAIFLVVFLASTGSFAIWQKQSDANLPIEIAPPYVGNWNESLPGIIFMALDFQFNALDNNAEADDIAYLAAVGYNSHVEHLIIPEYCTVTYKSAEISLSVKRIVSPDSTSDNILYFRNGKVISAIDEVEKGVFQNNKIVTQITIGEGIEYISNVFVGLLSLKKLIMPGFSSIYAAKGAFEASRYLESVETQRVFACRRSEIKDIFSMTKVNTNNLQVSQED